MERKKVSIVVPVYKVEKYLEQCLLSIVNQTYENLEIILVDDGSPDSCPEICDEWAKKDKRIKVFHKENGGLSDARNYGINKSTGYYLMFVDSDDWIDLTMVEKMVDSIENDNTDMAICQFVMVFPDGYTEKSIHNICDNIIVNKNEAISLLLEDNRVSSHVWRKIYKKDLFDCIFPVGKNYEDLYITWKLISNCKTISILDESLYFYRQNDKGIVSSINYKNVNDFYEGVVCCTNNITEKYPQFKYKIDNYIFDKMVNIYSLTYCINDNKKTKLLRKKIKQLLKTISFNNIAGIKNKIKFILLNYFNIYIKNNDFLKPIKTIRNKFKFLKKYKKDKDKCFWIFGTPEYGNLGDHLLLNAETKFISNYFPDYKIKYVSIDDLDKIDGLIIKYLIKKNDICSIQAGGNMGSLYPWINCRQEHIIDLCNKNKYKIFVFPQTYYYDKSENGTNILNCSKKIYNNNLIFVRDEKSSLLIKNEFQNSSIQVVPDIALFLTKNIARHERNGVLYCLRTDSESTINLREKEHLYNIVKKEFEKIDVCDTHVYVPLSPEDAKNEIEKLSEKFINSKLVITDRLHGMILAVITHTPCIVLNSKSHKILGVYNWIKDLNYIKLATNIEDVEKQINLLSQDNDFMINDIDLKSYWDLMYDCIRKDL